jgi:spermidine/putrescine transport system ATP-binding protein/putrescine transport system ATP-binding protein
VIVSKDENFIAINDVCKSFGSVQAVDHVSIGIGRGEFFSLLGPSGCGKTTLLRMLAGFEVPTSGEITIDGQPMSAVPPHRRPVNMVFQSYAIFPHLDVRANIAYGMRKDKLPKAELDARVEEMLETIKLPGYGSRRSHELSGGERQRVALARALIKRPKVLLLDEPLGALDKKLREQMQLELRQLQRAVGITFVFVTHDQEEALTMSDRIAVMSKGKVRQVDTPARLYEAPTSREVAAFIGSMNFIDATVEGEEGEMLVIDAGPAGKVRAELPADGAPARGTRIVIGIRPEKLVLSDTQPNSGANAVRGRLTAASYLGERSHYYLQVDGLPGPLSVARQNSQAKVADRTEAGSELWVSWQPEAAIVLPADR